MLNPLHRVIMHDQNSEGFVAAIRSVLSTPEDVQEVFRLEGPDARIFMNILDQAMDSPYSDDRLRRKCLLALRKICGKCGELPDSHMISDGLERTSEWALTSGGFADVWEGKFYANSVAIKAFRIYRTDNLVKVKKLFCKEAVTWKWLIHPNILRFIGASTSLFPLCMVSEWMPHGNVVVYLRSNPEANRLCLLVDVLRGLQYLHLRRIFHADLKGENILINNDFHACLADFGLTSIAHDTQSIGFSTTMNPGTGTTRWMAPELFDLGEPETDHAKSCVSYASDIYAFAMVVIEVFTGKVPFHQLRNDAVIFKVVTGVRPERPADSLVLGLFDRVWLMVQQCWQSRPDTRPAIEAVLSCFEEATTTFVPTPVVKQTFATSSVVDDEFLNPFDKLRLDSASDYDNSAVATLVTPPPQISPSLTLCPERYGETTNNTIRGILTDNNQRLGALGGDTDDTSISNVAFKQVDQEDHEEDYESNDEGDEFLKYNATMKGRSSVQSNLDETKMLIGSMSPPLIITKFLEENLPQVHETLRTLDISNNSLKYLSSVITSCKNLEELNIARNPLNMLPQFLSYITSLRILIADATGITTLPESLVSLGGLEVFSIRQNRLPFLPTWLCLLPSLESLSVDGNPFQGPWRTLCDMLSHSSARRPTQDLSKPSPKEIFRSPSVSLMDEFSSRNVAKMYIGLPPRPTSAHGGLQTNHVAVEPALSSIYGTQSPTFVSVGSAPTGTRAFLQDDEDLTMEVFYALRSVMAYLKDLHDLQRKTVISDSAVNRSNLVLEHSIIPDSSNATLEKSTRDQNDHFVDVRYIRPMIVREIVETERSYVKHLEELMNIYVYPSSSPARALNALVRTKETVIPVAERHAVFAGLEDLFSFHKERLLPSLEVAAAPVMKFVNDMVDSSLSLDVARSVAGVFASQATTMGMYTTYIQNSDNSLQRVRQWTQLPFLSSSSTAGSASNIPLSSNHKKRISTFLKQCSTNPRHSQPNLEAYLLTPVERISRYRLLLESLRDTCLHNPDDPMDQAVSGMVSLEPQISEHVRETASRKRLVEWQAKIRGAFLSPLVQPHRRYIMEGRLKLKRVVRMTSVSFRADGSEHPPVEVECLKSDLTPRALIGILCNDLMVLCLDGVDKPDSAAECWAVLRIQTLRPASVYRNSLRLVDNQAILYFDVPSLSDALRWSRAINSHLSTPNHN